MGTKEKLKQYADYKGFTTYKIEKILGLTNGSLRSGKDFGVDKISIIRDNCPDLNMNWFLYDEGEMILKKDIVDTENYVNEELDVYKKLPKGIPYYDVEFESGFDFLENNQAVMPSNYINHPFFSSSEFVVRNSGQSMAKVIKHGDAIGMVHLKHWREFLAFGEIYALVLKDNRRLIKVITKGETPDTFTLLSKPMDNKKEEFPPQQIKKSFITNVFKVEAYSGKF